MIVRKRIEKGMTSAELADRIEVSQSCLSRIENGSREARLEILRRLNNALNIEKNLSQFLKNGTF